MAFLTTIGLKKLEVLEKEITNLKDKKSTNKDDYYSKGMIKKSLEIIEVIKKNNAEGSLFSLKGLGKIIKPLMLALDGNSYTGIPIIFNEKSLFLSQELLKFLTSLNLNEDLDPTVLKGLSVAKLISPKKDPHAFVAHYTESIQSSIMLYQKLTAGKIHAEQAEQLRNKICNLFSPSKKNSDFYSSKKELLDKLKNNEIKEDDFRKEYAVQIEQLWNQMLKISYVTITHFTDKPSPFNMDHIHVKSLGNELFKELQKYEMKVNEVLLKKKWNEANVVGTFAKKLFSKETISQRKKQLLELFKQMEKEIKPHCSAKKFIWSTPEKTPFTNILKEVNLRIELEQTNQPNCSNSIINLFKIIFSAVIHDKEIGKILRKYQKPLLEFAIERTWGDDEDHYYALNKQSTSLSSKLIS